MRLLFDENLSRRLVTRLADTFSDSSHVSAVGLQRATDREVWDYARSHGYVLVSKDSDFNDLAFVHGHHRKWSGCASAMPPPTPSQSWPWGCSGRAVRR